MMGRFWATILGCGLIVGMAACGGGGSQGGGPNPTPTPTPTATPTPSPSPTPAGTLAPVIAESFAAASVPVDGNTSLNFTLANPPANTRTLSGVAFTDSLPA